MASVQVNCVNSGAAAAIAVECLTVHDGRRFLSLSIGDASVILPGFDAEAVESARRIAEALMDGVWQAQRALDAARETQPA